MTSVCVLGSINLDLVVRAPRLPLPGETVAGSAIAQYPGGKGANQAVAAARLGAETRMVGAVGDDAAGAWMLARLDEAGVDRGLVRARGGQPTGQAFITVADSGENAIVVVGGANQSLTEADLGLTGLPPAAVWVAQLETPPGAIAALFASPQGRAGLRILNAAPALPEGRDLFALTDILILNETELAAYAGGSADRPWGDDLRAAARSLVSRPDQWVVITLGAAGVGAVSRDEALLVAGRSMPVVDTTGAGDCFCGALAARLAQGEPLAKALIFANAAAGLSVGRPGAASAMPSRAEVEALLAEG